MLKKYLVCAGIILLASTSLAFANENTGSGGTNTDSGGTGNLDSTNGKIAVGTGATEFTFQTSPQVQTKGTSTAQGFVLAAAHEAVLGKTGGLAYAMSSETSSLYTKDVSEKKEDFVEPTTYSDAGIGDYELEGVTGTEK